MAPRKILPVSLIAVLVCTTVASAGIDPWDPNCNSCSLVVDHSVSVSLSPSGANTVDATLDYQAFCADGYIWGPCGGGDIWYGVIGGLSNHQAVSYNWTTSSVACTPKCETGTLAITNHFSGYLYPGTYHIDFDASAHNPSGSNCSALCQWTEYFTVPDCFYDLDGDGFNMCQDCDEGDPAVHLGAAEICDRKDSNCDGTLGPEEMDNDGDGYTPCEGDCDDAHAAAHPGGVEICDGLDNDCDGNVDNLDADGDGFNPCIDDCDDTNASIHPGATETCDRKDDNCDGIIPPEEIDGDHDGYATCEGDCDDLHSLVHPGAHEVCNLIDDNCDGLTDETATCITDPEGSCDITVSNDPINAANGNLQTISKSDLLVRGSSMNIEFARTYNSRSTHQGTLGYGWNHSFDQYLEVTQYDEVIIHNETGRANIYVLEEDGTYLGRTGENGHVVKETDGTFTHYRGTRQFKFSATGRLQKIVDFRGNAIELQFTGDLPTGIVEMPAGSGSVTRTVKLEYSADGRLWKLYPSETTITPVVEYRYDTLGNLTDALYAGGSALHYFYEDPNDPHNLSRVTDSAGRLVDSIEYDAWDRAVTSYKEGNLHYLTLSYDDANRTTTVTTPVGTRTLTYDFVANVPVVVSATGSSCNCSQTKTWDPVDFAITRKVDNRGMVTLYEEIDRWGNAGKITRAAGTPQEQVWQYYYDPMWHKVSRETKPNGARTYYYYDTYGNPSKTVVWGTGNPTVEIYQYDTLGRLTFDGSHAYYYHPMVAGDPESGRLQLKRGAWNDSYSIQFDNYDAFGNPGVEVPIDSPARYLFYDSLGRLQRRSMANGYVSYAYDPLGYIDYIIYPGGRRFDYEHDVKGHLLSLADPYGNRIVYTYDDQGNKTAEERFDTGGTRFYHRSFVYDSDNRLWKAIYADGTFDEYEYDAGGNILRQWDGKRNLVENIYDSLGRLKTTSRNGVVTAEHAYNNIDQVSSVKDGNGLATLYGYDAYFGFLVTANSPDTGVTRYTDYYLGTEYNPGPGQHGLLKTKVDAAGKSTLYTYGFFNGKALPVSVTATDTAGNSIIHGFTYWPGGLPRQVTVNGEVLFDYGYDALHDLTGDKYFYIDGATYRTVYQYNDNNELTSLTYPSGRVVTYQRDSAGRVIHVLGNMGQGNIGYAVNATYYPFGGLKAFTRMNGLTEAIVLDQDYRVAGIASGTIYSRTFGYDTDGTVSGITDGIHPWGAQAFGYDTQGRLETATGPYGALAWSYDHNGNRLSENRNGLVTAYGYSAQSNRLASLSGAESATIIYNTAANIVSDGNHTYGYNPMGRLATVDGAVGYTYAPSGERVRKVLADGTIRHYHYDLDGRLISESAGDGMWLIDYIWFEGRLLARIENGLVAEAEEGYILSRRSDLLSDERAYVLADDLNVKLWTTEVDPAQVFAAKATVKSVLNTRLSETITLTNQGNGSYTGTIDLSALSLSRGGNVWTWNATVTDTAGRSYQPTATVYVYATAAHLEVPGDIDADGVLLASLGDLRWGTGIDWDGRWSSSLEGREVEAGEGAPIGPGFHADLPEIRLAGKIVPPTVTSCSPSSGSTAGGTQVTVTGTGFKSGATITFGGAYATGVTFVSSTTLRGYTPAHAAGAVSVTVVNPDGYTGSLGSGFTYVVTQPAPTVSSCSPASGDARGGTYVTVTGTLFQSGATVRFGGSTVPATFNSSTELRCYAPAQPAGTVDVTVTNPDGQSGTHVGGFTYLNVPYDVVYYYHVDHLGTPQGLSSLSKQMVWEAAQEPFGKVVPVATGIPLSERVRFPGQYYDAESGLHQNWWRDYSPKTGRYLEPDPIGLDGGMNLYKYALNSPVNSTDRRGLYDEEGHGKSTEAAREIGVLNFIANAITQANVDTDRLFNPCDCSATTNKYHFNTRDGAWKMIRDAPNIVVLGRALHALQDTYAHAGMTCGVNSGRRHLMGNPDKFVGNSRDLQMMKATEEALRAYFENHPMRKDQ